MMFSPACWESMLIDRTLLRRCQSVFDDGMVSWSWSRLRDDGETLDVLITVDIFLLLTAADTRHSLIILYYNNLEH